MTRPPPTRCHLRARIEVRNPDGTMVSDSGWGPWKLGTTWLGRWLQAALFTASLNHLTPTTSVKDVTGASVTLDPHIGGTNHSLSTNGGDGVSTYCQLAYGNGAANPTRLDTEISGAFARMNLTGSIHDEELAVIELAASRQHTEAGTTLTRAGLYYRFRTATTNVWVLLDHATISPRVVTQNQTVTVRYQVAY